MDQVRASGHPAGAEAVVTSGETVRDGGARVALGCLGRCRTWAWGCCRFDSDRGAAGLAFGGEPEGPQEFGGAASVCSPGRTSGFVLC